MPEACPPARMDLADRDNVLEVKVKTMFSGDVMILYMHPPMTLDAFEAEIREACQLDHRQLFTIKWLDDDGDPCTISSQLELNEAFRLYELNRDSELLVHVFASIPVQPGLPCVGEDRYVYRRGARRWKKFYRVNGHLFQAKRFNRSAVCAICRDKVWGLGRQGYRCANCKIPVHKKCHKLVKNICSGQPVANYATDDSFGSGSQSSTSRDVHNASLPSKMSSLVHATANGAGQIDGRAAYVNHSMEGMTEETAVQTEEAVDTVEKRVSAPTQDRLFPISLEDFDLLRVIGRGSYAKVLQVELKKNKQIYAMKIIKKELVNDDEDIDWVQTEKHVFEVASNHPFLVGLHSCFQTASRLFFVIEFVPGGDLMFHMQNQRRLPEEHARFYAAEIVLALHYLHSRGIIYRDLKLDNVLIDADGHVKLTDYGMCKEGIGPGDTTSTFCGTPNYIAPEILRGEEYSFSVDWWALGVLMYEMMAGRSPFDIVGSMENPDVNSEDYLFQIILEKQIRIPRSLSVKASSVLKGFLNKNPLERLGCHSISGIEDIKNHPFFRNVEWDSLEQRQVVPPYKPPIRDERDLTNFDKQFTDEPVQLTPDDGNAVSKIDQSEFDGFEYINPLLMSREDTV